MFCFVNYREVENEMQESKGGCNEDRKNIEKGMVSENGNEAYNTLNALTKTQQHKSAKTAVRLTTPSMPSPRPNSISQRRQQ